jgi:hypothetical protein
MSKELVQISQAQRAIEVANTPEEANEIRARLKAIRKYLSKRADHFGDAFEAAKFECEAAAKAGQLWARERPGSGGTDHGKREVSRLQDAGFVDSKDATICVRLGELDPQDTKLYFEEMQDKKRYPTENGLISVWKMLNDCDDIERPWLRIYNVWNFQKCDERFGIQHPGQIPGQIMQNLNWYFTKPKDLVVDLFAGGGSTLDVCKYDDDDFGNRACEAYDIQPVRKDIHKRDIVGEGIPDISRAQLVFLDPPYWAQKRGEYSADPTNLANLDLASFYSATSKIANDCLAAVGQGAIVALIVGGAEFLAKHTRGKDHALEIVARVKGELIQRIIVPYSTETYQAHDVTRAKETQGMLNLYRDLLVWEAR